MVWWVVALAAALRTASLPEAPSPRRRRLRPSSASGPSALAPRRGGRGGGRRTLSGQSVPEAAREYALAIVSNRSALRIVLRCRMNPCCWVGIQETRISEMGRFAAASNAFADVFMSASGRVLLAFRARRPERGLSCASVPLGRNTATE